MTAWVVVTARPAVALVILTILITLVEAVEVVMGVAAVAAVVGVGVVVAAPPVDPVGDVHQDVAQLQAVVEPVATSHVNTLNMTTSTPWRTITSPCLRPTETKLPMLDLTCANQSFSNSRGEGSARLEARDLEKSKCSECSARQGSRVPELHRITLCFLLFLISAAILFKIL